MYYRVGSKSEVFRFWTKYGINSLPYYLSSRDSPTLDCKLFLCLARKLIPILNIYFFQTHSNVLFQFSEVLSEREDGISRMFYVFDFLMLTRKPKIESVNILVILILVKIQILHWFECVGPHETTMFHCVSI